MLHDSTLCAWLANFFECQNKIRPDFNFEMDILISRIDAVRLSKVGILIYYESSLLLERLMADIYKNLPLPPTRCGFPQRMGSRRGRDSRRQRRKTPLRRPERLAGTCALKRPPLPSLDTLWHDLEALNRFLVFLQQLLLILALSLVLLFIHSEFPGGRRYLCTTMPWTIWPALAVLWGVCWMFYPSPTEGQLALENLDLLLDRLDQGK